MILTGSGILTPGGTNTLMMPMTLVMAVTARGFKRIAHRLRPAGARARETAISCCAGTAPSPCRCRPFHMISHSFRRVRGGHAEATSSRTPC